MMTPKFLFAATAATMSLAACEPAAQPTQPAQPPAEMATAAPAAAPETPATPKPAAETDTPKGLERYVGQYPSAGFLKDAAVMAVIDKVPAAAKTFVRGQSTEVPIFKAGDKIVANGCEPHNCSGHNWAVMMKADGKSGDVCVFKADKPGPGEMGLATWYLADGKTIKGNVTTCPSSAEEVESQYPAN